MSVSAQILCSALSHRGVGRSPGGGTVQGGQSRGGSSPSAAALPHPSHGFPPKPPPICSHSFILAPGGPAGEGFSPRAQGPGCFQTGSPGGSGPASVACGPGSPQGYWGGGGRRGLKRPFLPWALEEAMALRGGAVLPWALLNVAEPIGVPGTPEGRRLSTRCPCG